VISANSTYFFNLAAHFRNHYADGGFGRKAGNLASLAIRRLTPRQKQKGCPGIRGSLFVGCLTLD
jgi:hypothetical protein